MELNDLLEETNAFSFETISNQRIIYTALRILSRIFSPLSEPSLIRAEIELTHRCNFNCTYCRTRLPLSCEENSLNHCEIVSLINKYSAAGCKYLHFTGGEISLLDNVPSLVSTAVALGMKVGVSSNGSGRIPFYRTLIEAGTSFIHISFDEISELRFECLTSHKGSWRPVASTISFLCREAKALNPDLFVVANVVLTEQNVKFLPQTIEYLIDLGVNDIKLQPALGKTPDLTRVGDHFQTEIKATIEKKLVRMQRCDILKLRLNEMLTGRTHGIGGSGLKHSLSACEICTEQAMVRADGTYAPCYIYMRENYSAHEYGMGTIKDELIDYCNRADIALSNKYSTDHTCLSHCPDIIYYANYRSQEIVVNCIASLIKSYDRSKGITFGELTLTYKDLEAPFYRPKKEFLDYHILAIPTPYFDQLQGVLSLVGSSQPIEDQALVQGFKFEDSDPKTDVQATIVQRVLSRFKNQYLLYKTKRLTCDEIERIKQHANEILKQKLLKVHLFWGEVEIASSRIPIPPVIFQDWRKP